MVTDGARSVTIRGDEFKFSCAHFVSYNGFRERLHGHNYTVEVEMTGPMHADDGYVIDFGVLKKHIRMLCKSLNERVIVPLNSDTLTIRFKDSPPEQVTFITCGGPDEEYTEKVSGQVEITCKSAFFSFPRDDCALLPIKVSTAENLSAYLSGQLEEALRADIADRKIETLTMRVFERPTQAASYTIAVKK